MSGGERQITSGKPAGDAARQAAGSNTMPLGRGGNFGRHPLVGGKVVKAKDSKKTLSRLWQYFYGIRIKFLLVWMLTLVSGGLGIMSPYWIGRAIDLMAAGTGTVAVGKLYQVIFILIAVYLLDATMTFFQDWMMAGISQSIVRSLRQSMFGKLHHLPIGFFDSHSNGDIMSRLTNDIDQISSMIGQTTTQLMTGSILIVGSLGMMLWLSPTMTLVAMVVIPLMFLLTKAITNKTKQLYKHQQSRLGQLNGLIEESISGLSVIKAFGQEERMIDDFKKLNNELCEVGIKVNIISGYLMPFMNVINNVSFTLLAFTGGYLALNGHVTIGVVTSFFSYSKQFTRPLINLSSLYNALQSAIAGAERVFEIMDESEELVDNDNTLLLEDSSGHVIFDQVTFGYLPEVNVLKKVSFEAKPGSTIALVGPTGGGKTTIVNLLSRFYEVNSGEISIDGQPIHKYSRESLRRTFGVVLQETYLFSGTILDNIKYGNPDASDKEVKEAAMIANADGFIRRLPKGYDTWLIESGRNLSQGERQLIAIARAVLTDHRILVLDEATSNIDTRTEKHIQEALLKLMSGRTSFVIAHRLSTIREADWILVIDQGRVAEQGTHQSLMTDRGLYYQFNQNMNQ